MALRNFDLDSAVRSICHGNSESCFGALADACNVKLKKLGLKLDSSKAVARAPRHRGRRNPLSGELKGSGDLNVRGLIDWVDSIKSLPQLEADATATPEHEVALKEMQAAHDGLMVVAATLAAHAK